MKTKSQHAVAVELYDLPLTQSKGDRYGKVISPSTISEDDLIQLAVERRTDLNPSTLRASLEILSRLAEEKILEGCSVTFGLSHYSTVVNGLFEGDDDRWDADRHSLGLRITPKATLRDQLPTVEVKILGPATTGPVINTITDHASGTVNQQLTPGGVVYIDGKRLKIVGTAPEVGLSLINITTGEELLLAPSTLFQNTRSRLGILLPTEIVPGTYNMKVSTQYSRSNVVNKTPSTFIFPVSLKIT